MMSAIVILGPWAAAIGCGLMAGIYFAFSTFIMKALRAAPDSEGIATMQSINEVIVSSPFLPLFFGTSFVALGLAGWSLTRWSEPGATALFAGGSIYFVGMFLCTVVFNVPLNDSLAALDAHGDEAATTWSSYLHRWTLWNHVRTIASTTACGLFILAIASRV